MPDQNDALINAFGAALPPLLTGLDVLANIARHLHPPHLPELVTRWGGADASVREGLAAFQNVPWPEHLVSVKTQLELAAGEVCEAFAGLRAANANPNGLMEAYYALRHAIRAQEALYPLTSVLPMVSRFFLDPPARSDEALLARLEEGAGRPNTGIMISKNTSGETRGGFSLYVPESYDDAKQHPLIFALHGGSGNGRAFLWTWLRAARTNGAILVSPSSRGQTWSLEGRDIDTPNLLSMMAYVRERWSVDEKHMLMTGMSDGGTFTYISGLQAENPFTHLAPVAASFHPMFIEFFDAERLKGMPMHITHGALDWMFPYLNARDIAMALTVAGAEVVYRELADLSHTNPSGEENAQVMDWFLGRASERE